MRVNKMKKYKSEINNLLKIFLICLVFLSPKISSAQTDTIKVKTSAICDQCKETIERDLSFEKGVKKSTLDLETKILTVVYNPDKTNAEKIMKAITESGYDADTLKANPKAFRRLPDCCKKPSSTNH